LATAAAFFGTIVCQVSLRQTVQLSPNSITTTLQRTLSRTQIMLPTFMICDWLCCWLSPCTVTD